MKEFLKEIEDYLNEWSLTELHDLKDMVVKEDNKQLNVMTERIGRSLYTLYERVRSVREKMEEADGK